MNIIYIQNAHLTNINWMIGSTLTLLLASTPTPTTTPLTPIISHPPAPSPRFCWLCSYRWSSLAIASRTRSLEWGSTSDWTEQPTRTYVILLRCPRISMAGWSGSSKCTRCSSWSSELNGRYLLCFHSQLSECIWHWQGRVDQEQGV